MRKTVKRKKCSMSDWYWLNGDHTVRPGPSIDDAKAFTEYSSWLYGETNGRPNRLVDRTETRSGLFVSTVFLGLDHSYINPSPPALFETMVFEGEDFMNSISSRRYTTWNQAVAGHKRMVEEHGGYLVVEPVTAQGAREYEEIMSLQPEKKEDLPVVSRASHYS